MNTNPDQTDTSAIDMLKEAWPIFLNNGAVTIGGAAFLNLVPMIVIGVPASIAAFLVAGMAAFKHQNSFGALLPIIVISAPLFAVMYNYFRAGWIKMLLGVASGERVQFGDIFTAGKPWFVPFLLTKVIVSIAVTIGGIMLVLPGIYIMVRTAFAEFLIIDENMQPVDAIKASHDMVTGYGWQLLIYYGLLFCANWVAGIVPLVGFILPFFVLGLFDVTLAMMYVMRRGNGPFGDDRMIASR